MFLERASPMMLRAPNARGPNSILPSNQPITFSFEMRVGDNTGEILLR